MSPIFPFTGKKITMLRLLITLLLPLLLPVLAYYFLQTFAAQKQHGQNASEDHPTSPQRLDKGGLFWSFAIGAVLAIISVLTFGLQDITPADRVYVPAKKENGIIIPGKFIDHPPEK